MLIVRGKNKKTGLSGIESIKAQKLEELKKVTDKAFARLNTKYSASEISTFDQQVREALLLKDNENSDIELLNTIAQHREITVQELAEKVLKHHKENTQAVGEILGKSQKLNKDIENANTREELNNIILDI